MIDEWLWSTRGACRWVENRDKWMHGAFSSLDAEAVERDVDAYANTISKAVKFFEREQKEGQAGECCPLTH